MESNKQEHNNNNNNIERPKVSFIGINDADGDDNDNDQSTTLSHQEELLLSNNFSIIDKEHLQQKLRFYFMSPLDKWRTKKRFPFKLLFQMLKIIFVTFQLINFGQEMSDYITQDDHIENAFRNILLDDWDQTREVFAYPPATGDYAVYTTQHFYSSLDFAIRKFSNLSKLSVGCFGFERQEYPRFLIRKTFFTKRKLDPTNFAYNLDNNNIDSEILDIDNLYPSGDQKWYDEFTTKNYFHSKNFTLSFDSLMKLQLIFPLRTILLDDEILPRCFDFNITIIYDNHAHDAMIKVNLKINRQARSCHYINQDGTLQQQSIGTGLNLGSNIELIMAINYTVILFCSISTMLCIRSLYRGQLLRLETEKYFNESSLPDDKKKLSFEDKMEFIDIGLMIICLNDFLIICGSIMKIRMESSDSMDSILYTSCSLFLGIGNLLVWLGLLRYFAYFQSYNILIVTLKKSIPNVLRFCLCAFLVYGGFCFCGWVVLGPHHLKFRTLSSTLECLFSLMNGDDMFATFFSTDVRKSTLIWWFSRIYLYLFISLSIYVIVSLFIAIILDAYESVRDSYKEIDSLSKSESLLKKFIDEYPLENFDGGFHNNSIVDQIQNYFRICFGRS
uniref:Mucolipin-3-like n=1 Tax=Dermatophagoides pteronyssinus TaxID=6956 RepID=A0A6P6XUV5_DERPT|nr:mucolipin-3-like [Dermatophagoides pteronyssinus]